MQIAPEVVNPPQRQTGHPARKTRPTKKTGPQQSHVSQEETLNPDNLQGVGALLPSVSEKLPKPKPPQGVGALVSNDREGKRCQALSFHENTVSNKSALSRISNNVDDSHTANITASASPPAKKNPQPHCPPKPWAQQGEQVSSSVQEEGKGEPVLGLSHSYVTNTATAYNKKNTDDNHQHITTKTTLTSGQLAKKATQPHCSPKAGALPGEKVSSPVQDIEPMRPSLQDQPYLQAFTELKEMNSHSPSHSPKEPRFSTLL